MRLTLMTIHQLRQGNSERSKAPIRDFGGGGRSRSSGSGCYKVASFPGRTFSCCDHIEQGKRDGTNASQSVECNHSFIAASIQLHSKPK